MQSITRKKDLFMYTNYIFDLYGTLVDIHTNKKSKILWSKLSLFYSFNGAIYSSDELKASYLNKFKKNRNLYLILNIQISH